MSQEAIRLCGYRKVGGTYLVGSIFTKSCDYVWFQGETGDYWSKRMSELREQGVDHVAASKAVGWEKRD
jgi:hypothetical protein